MKNLSYLLLMLLALSFTGCEDEDELPKPTQTGAGMMAARINGKPWQHNGSSGTLGLKKVHLGYSPNGAFQLMGRRVDNDFNNLITIELVNVTRIGRYDLMEKDSKSYANLLETIDESNTRDYYTTATSTGTVTITKLDPSNKIISGTFSFKAQNRYNPNEFVEVTEGWFDVKYE